MDNEATLFLRHRRVIRVDEVVDISILGFFVVDRRVGDESDEIVEILRIEMLLEHEILIVLPDLFLEVWRDVFLELVEVDIRAQWILLSFLLYKLMVNEMSAIIR